jgi:hypothetical protein
MISQRPIQNSGSTRRILSSTYDRRGGIPDRWLRDASDAPIWALQQLVAGFDLRSQFWTHVPCGSRKSTGRDTRQIWASE